MDSPGVVLRSGQAYVKGAKFPVLHVKLTVSGWLETPSAWTTSVALYEPDTSGVKVGRTDVGFTREAVLPVGLAVNVH